MSGEEGKVIELLWAFLLVFLVSAFESFQVSYQEFWGLLNLGCNYKTSLCSSYKKSVGNKNIKQHSKTICSFSGIWCNEKLEFTRRQSFSTICCSHRGHFALEQEQGAATTCKVHLINLKSECIFMHSVSIHVWPQKFWFDS